MIEKLFFKKSMKTLEALGLMADSGVTIVGAMLIAPMMKPIMSFSYGVTIADKMLKLRSIITLIFGIFLTLLIAFSVESILGLNSLTSQMVSRIEPNLIDLGVAIAAGIAAAVAVTRREVADALPGVAIAVALVPPLCVSGISISMGEWHAFFGSLLLFGINLLAIVSSAVIVFLLSGYGSIKLAINQITIISMMLLVLGWPLNQSLNLLKEDDTAQYIVEKWLHENYPDNINIHPNDLIGLSLQKQKDHLFIFLQLKSPKKALTDKQLKHIHSKLEQSFNVPVNLKIQLQLTEDRLQYSHLKKDGSTPVYGVESIVPRR